MAIEVGTAYISILPSTNKLSSGIARELRSVESQAKIAGDRAGDSFGSRFKSRIVDVLKKGALLGLAGGSFLAGAGIKTAAELEQAQIGFETMLGSAEKADRFLQKIKTTAAKTPFELPGLTQSSQKLLAFGFEVEKVIPTLTTLGDAAAGLGVGQEGLDRIINAVGQIQAKGRLQGEELLQLTEVGIPAARILRNELGLSAEQFEEMQMKGKLTAEKVIPALLRGIKHGTSGVAGETAKFGGLMEKQANSLSGLWSTLQDTLLVGMATALEPLIPVLKQGLVGGIKAAEPALQGFGQALATTVSFIIDAVKWGREHSTLVTTAAVVVGGLATAVWAYNAAVRVAAAVTAAWNTVQKLLNRTLTLSPIGLVAAALVALGVAFVLAWKHSETFREIVTRAWTGIRKATETAWKKVIRPALKAFVDFLKNPVFPIVKALWNNIVKPYFKRVGDTIKFLWNKIAKPVFTAWKKFFQSVLFPVLRFLWSKVIKPVFKYVGTEIKQFWTGIGKPIFAAWKKYFQTVLFPVIRFLWNKVVKPVFGGIKKTISTVWNSGIKPVFERLKDGVDAVAKAFRTAKDAIGAAWSKIRGIVAKPIRFVIDKVYNNGIRKVVNWLDFLPGIPTLEEVKGWATGGYTGPGGKYTPAGIVHAGEYVIRKESTEKLQKTAPGLLDALNRSGRLPGYWVGGGVNPLPGYRVTNFHGTNYYDAKWAGDMAAPSGSRVVAWKDGSVAEVSHNVGSYGNETVINHPTGEWTRYAHQSKILVRVGEAVKRGQLIGYSGATGNVSGPHLHFEIGGGAKPYQFNWGEIFSGEGGGGWNPLDKIREWKDKIDEVRATLSRLNNNSFARSFKDGFGDVLGKLKDWGIDKIKSAATKFFELPANNPFPHEGGKIRDIVGSVAAKYGWSSGAQWEALTALIDAESDWDPTAKNPSSSAYGLFQFLDSTWATVGGRKTSDPYLQAVYGLKYIKQRYGDPIGAWDFWRANGWYDSGGVLEPGGIAINTSRKPEAIFNHTQFKEFAREAGGRFPDRVTLVVGDREFDAYIREKADDAINGDRAYQGALRRMRY